MIFCILGESCVGKDAIFQRLRNHTSLKPIVTTTSRPKRELEKNHYDYHFVTKERFIQSVDNNDFIEYTTYNVANSDTWYYGTKWNEFYGDSHKVVIVNPSGFSSMVNTYGNRNVVGIVIERDLRNRAISYLQRSNDADYHEMIRRFYADMKDFSHLNKGSSNNIYHVENITGQFEKCVFEVEKIIGRYLK